MTVVVIGAGSMIAQALRRQPATSGWLYLPHRRALEDVSWAGDATCVLNLAFDPRLKSGEYQEALDLDLRLARLISDRSAHYIMPSSRMAYGPADAGGRLSEDSPSCPANPYGRGKLAAEQAVAATLGDRTTILRLSNIFDQSEAEGERRSFLGMALRRLKRDGRIEFDMSPLVARDFLPANLLARQLVRIVAQPMPGLFNIGAGFGVPAGRIAEWLIAGFGSGGLLVTDMRERDGFWLDMEKSRRTWDLPSVTLDDVREACIAAGVHARAIP